jgi:hypothetical protein
MITKFSKFVLILIVSGLILSLSFPLIVKAHFQTIGYSEIYIEDQSIAYSLYLDPYQVIDEIPELDADGDMYIVKSEITNVQSQLEELIKQELVLKVNKEINELTVNGVSLENRNKIPMIHIELEYFSQETISSYEIEYNLFFERSDPQHQNFASIRSFGKRQETIFKNKDRAVKGSSEAVQSAFIDVPDWLLNKKMILIGLILLGGVGMGAKKIYQNTLRTTRKEV